MCHPYNGTQLSNKKKEAIDSCHNIDKSPGKFPEYIKLVTVTQ